jgi:hypothetical protein
MRSTRVFPWPGEIVAWLNSDDVLLSGAVTRAVNAFVPASPAIGAISGEG